MGNYDFNKYSNYEGPYRNYASQTVTISGVVSDYSLKDNSTLFDLVTAPFEFTIRNRDDDLYVKLNDDGNDSIYVPSDTEFGLNNLVVTDIFISTTVSGANVFDVLTLGYR
jgi:hypothetical protein